MKSAREWADKLWGCDVGSADIDHVRKIQADALRHAASIARANNGLAVISADHILAAAEDLCPPITTPQTQSCPTCSHAHKP